MLASSCSDCLKFLDLGVVPGQNPRLCWTLQSNIGPGDFQARNDPANLVSSMRPHPYGHVAAVVDGYKTFFRAERDALDVVLVWDVAELDMNARLYRIITTLRHWN